MITRDDTSRHIQPRRPYLGEPGVRELVETQLLLLPRQVGQLSQVDPGGCNGGRRHPVAQEQDQVLGDSLAGPRLQPVLDRRRALVVPELGGCTERNEYAMLMGMVSSNTGVKREFMAIIFCYEGCYMLCLHILRK